MFKTKWQKKYEKVMELLDDEIKIASGMHDYYLHLYDDVERTEGQIRNDMCKRGGQWSMVDKFQGQLDVLCHLKRNIQNKI